MAITLLDCPQSCTHARAPLEHTTAKPMVVGDLDGSREVEETVRLIRPDGAGCRPSTEGHPRGTDNPRVERTIRTPEGIALCHHTTHLTRTEPSQTPVLPSMEHVAAWSVDARKWRTWVVEESSGGGSCRSSCRTAVCPVLGGG